MNEDDAADVPARVIESFGAKAEDTAGTIKDGAASAWDAVTPG